MDWTHLGWLTAGLILGGAMGIILMCILQMEQEDRWQ